MAGKVLPESLNRVQHAEHAAIRNESLGLDSISRVVRKASAASQYANEGLNGNTSFGTRDHSRPPMTESDHVLDGSRNPTRVVNRNIAGKAFCERSDESGVLYLL